MLRRFLDRQNRTQHIDIELMMEILLGDRLERRKTKGTNSVKID
jgi:hypothetical protein